MDSSYYAPVPSPRYYECHVTLEPVFDERLEQLQALAKQYGFQVAKLLLKRRASDTEKRSSKDSFCTYKCIEYVPTKIVMDNFVSVLRREGFQVWRQKIEAVVYDERTKG